MEEDFNETDAETFFDLDHATFGNDDELNDEETFGDIGPLSDDWQFSHDKFARIVETEKSFSLLPDGGEEPLPERNAMHLAEDEPVERLERRDSLSRVNEPHVGFHGNTPPQQVPSTPAKAIPGMETGYFWGSPGPASSPGNGNSIWGSPSQRSNNELIMNAKPSLIPTEPPKQQQQQPFSPIIIKNTPEAEQVVDPIAKLFSSIATGGVAVSEQAPAFPGSGITPGNILSAEELEARLSRSVQTNIPPNANQLPPPNFNPWPAHHQPSPSPSHIPPSAVPVAMQTDNRMYSPLNGPHQQSHSANLHSQHPAYPQFLYHNFPSRRWKESKKMMTADEIDSIIRLQYAQIQTDNPYVEDYYYQTAVQKALKSQGNVHSITNHKPICESTPRPTRKPTDQPPGVLGRIPSHSVRAPRPLLQVKGANGTVLKPEENQAEQDQEKALSYAIILTIEDAFNCVLDAEDIDQLMNSPAARDNRAYLTHLFSKRVAITEELFKLLNIYVPKAGAGAEDHMLQDNILLKMLLVTKGRKLLTRVIPLLFAEQFHFLFLFFMRNLSLLLQILPQTADADDEKATNAFFEQMAAKVSVLKLPNLSYALDTLVFYHTSLLLELLQVEKALSLISTILQRAQTMVTAQLRTEMDNMYIMQWNGVFNLFLHQVFEILPVLFAYNQNANENRAFARFANIIYASADESQKPKLLQLLSSWSYSSSSNQPTMKPF